VLLNVAAPAPGDPDGLVVSMREEPMGAENDCVFHFSSMKSKFVCIVCCHGLTYFNEATGTTSRGAPRLRGEGRKKMCVEDLEGSRDEFLERLQI
jgi:hypothetical protein